MNKFSVIITAGGIGKRMGGDLPKQFLELNNLPMLMHTIRVFHDFDSSAQLILTLPAEWQEYWATLCAKHQFNIPHQVVDGGKERYHSIQNALNYCQGDYVAIHDGVRPFVDQKTLMNCWNGVQEFGAVIPVLALKESLRKVGENESNSVNRSEFRIVQTPQCFKKDILLVAYQKSFHEGITDDASLVEEAGYVIHLVEGNEQNIKITTPTDLRFADFLLRS
jgi:2-C-methyl-D-erythritol 4-phosphate cytidylyltransferase